MSAPALLREIEAAGIRLHREGDRLRAEIPPGADLAPFRERIQAAKPALMRELLQRESVATATVGPKHFDRKRFGGLQQQWSALPDPEAQVAALVDHLEAGWVWLDGHPNHPEAEAFLTRWIERLRQYERAYAAREQGGTP
jgi:hypothetical protein